MDRMSSGSLLQCRKISRLFGGLEALMDVSLEIRKGEIFGLVGPNGSGKTTLVNTITGFYPPQKGSIYFEGEEITGLKPYSITKLGIARTFQNLALFKGMTVLDNIMLGRHIHMRTGMLRTAFYWWWARKEEVANRIVVEEIIDFLQLESVRKAPVDIIPLGVQKRVELARALVAQPKLLILDEPMSGMNQEEKEYMARFILDISYERGCTILLIEHHLDVVVGISDRMAVLNYGKKIKEGGPEDVVADQAVITAYLGEVKNV